MLQLITLLAISWLLIWLFEKRQLSVLGLIPTKRVLIWSVMLLLVSALIAAASFALRMLIIQEDYMMNPALTVRSVWINTWYQFRTVFTEELLCRGALLYILIQRIGSKKSILITALLFAVLHWLNAGIWGDGAQLILVFLFTFIMGLLLAYAFVKSGSLVTPLAIHFGWNWVQNYAFPESATGSHLFILAAPPPVVTISYLAFFTMLFLPKVLVLLVNYGLIKIYPQGTSA